MHFRRSLLLGHCDLRESVRYDHQCLCTDRFRSADCIVRHQDTASVDCDEDERVRSGHAHDSGRGFPAGAILRKPPKKLTTNFGWRKASTVGPSQGKQTSKEAGVS